MKLNCIIVDDEAIARKSIEKLCEKSEHLELIKICENAEQALDYLQNNEVDLIFLDVEMPGLTGIQMMDRICSQQQVILTTAKVEYAFEAFEHHVTDYLKKPISFHRFEEAVKKALDIHVKINNVQSNSKDIYIKEDGRLVRVSLDDILYVENAGDYLCIHTTYGKHIIYGTIRGIDKRLPKLKFLKVHRSYIVNLDKIKDIEETNLVIDRKMIPISRAHKNSLLGHLNLL